MHEPIVITAHGKMSIPPKPRKEIPWRMIWWVLSSIAAFVAISAAGFLLYTYFTSHQNTIIADETVQLITEVSMIILLPSDEQPTVATVSNLESLKDQEFFKNARIGDRVLMYPKNKKAILYSPEEKKVIEVAPITFDENLQ